MTLGQLVLVLLIAPPLLVGAVVMGLARTRRTDALRSGLWALTFAAGSLATLLVSIYLEIGSNSDMAGLLVVTAVPGLLLAAVAEGVSLRSGVRLGRGVHIATWTFLLLGTALLFGAQAVIGHFAR